MSEPVVIDLSEPTGWYEVAIFHHEDGEYEVVTDRGFGSLAVYATGNMDKALGVAEYLESAGRYRAGENGESLTNGGEPWDQDIYHWGCGCVDPRASRRQATERRRRHPRPNGPEENGR